MDIEEYRRTYAQSDGGPGWLAIDGALRPIYGDREPDWHLAPNVPMMLGGNDPLDGISIYARRDDPLPHLHYVSYGMSQLYYDDTAFGGEFSKFGCEFTFRLGLAKDAIPVPPAMPPVWPAHFMQNLARYVFQSGKWFEAGHYINANGRIALDSETDLTAATFTFDPELGSIQTLHGQVDFLQIIGLATEEFAAIKQSQCTPDDIVQRLKDGNPLLVTDLARKAVALK